MKTKRKDHKLSKRDSEDILGLIVVAFALGLVLDHLMIWICK